ncbi:MAG: fumarylacetoacetate hydrolase family protein [Solirubrobacteraceae bacterium]
MIRADGPPPLDPRIERGLWAQLKYLGQKELAGDRHVGWKAAFRTQGAMDVVGIDRPLLGFITESGVLTPGEPVALAGLTAPEIDLEIAVRLATDISPGSDAAAVRAAMGPLTVAVELNDYAPLPVDPEPVLATNVYHRGVILGPLDGRRTWPSCVATVELNGEQVHRHDHPGELPGELVEVLQEMSELLVTCGAKLRAGEVIITGGLVAPVKVAAGDSVRASVDPIGTLELAFV